MRATPATTGFAPFCSKCANTTAGKTSCRSRALDAYEHFLRHGTLERLWRAVREGKERWLAAARGLLALDPAGRGTAIEAMLGDGSAPSGARAAN